jgi:hypothetical protein
MSVASFLRTRITIDIQLACACYLPGAEEDVLNVLGLHEPCSFQTLELGGLLDTKHALEHFINLVYKSSHSQSITHQRQC